MFFLFNMDRLQLAAKVAQKAHTHNHFLLDMFPRTGKSAVSLEILKIWLQHKDFKILILTNSTTTNAQWWKNIKEHNPHLEDKFDILCYQSLHKIKDIYGAILLDEADLAFTDNRLEHLSALKPTHWIGMSGTWTFEAKNYFRGLTDNKHTTSIVTLEEAVKMGILPQPKIYKVEIDLDDSRRYLTVEMKGKGKGTDITTYPARWGSYKSFAKIILQCSEVEANEFHNQTVKRYSEWYEDLLLPPGERRLNLKLSPVVCRISYLRKALDRKNFFSHVKTRYFKHLHAQIIKNKPDSRMLVFCGAIAQAEFLNEEMAIHSKKPDTFETIEAFNNKEINTLMAVKILDRGVDLEEVDYAIIIQGDNSQGSVIQRAARSLLSVSPKIIIMCLKNTHDEKYVDKFLSNFPPDWVTTKQLKI